MLFPISWLKWVEFLYCDRFSSPVRFSCEHGSGRKGEGEKPIYAIQPSILRHKDGRLQVLCRTRNAQIATSWSSDNGETWSKVTLLDVPNNNSGTDA
ncbi:exo-alpha-sialidase, partial [Corynebacterium sp.]|uniref:exo-alpha-sialidase n=1 Tax=Corynebacterium sp. TaxID=1720 RepID=UPI00339013B0|nr:exo-alpha-sialidase [Corynebacterium sp.]